MNSFSVCLVCFFRCFVVMSITNSSVFRLFSDYIFLKLGEPSARAFHGKVLKSITMFNLCLKNHTVRSCLFSRELHVTMPVS